MQTRIEKDSLGEILVPIDKLWGAQTQRSFQNFKIGPKMPKQIIKAFAYLKAASAMANTNLGKMAKNKSDLITDACKKILKNELDDQFPLVVFQTGSGTQTNMNVNEVLAHLTKLHPNDDINMSQSSNDTFPTALHIASACMVEDSIIPALDKLIDTLKKLEEENKDIIKCGRTHLMDAVPLTFGQEISGWRFSLEQDKKMILSSLPYLKELALGGTAVGTGLNAPKFFDQEFINCLNSLNPKFNFTTSSNKFHALTSRDEVVFTHGALKALAADLLKIANDIRFLASGPRNGLGEIFIPENEPGSSIMPGKVNPTQCEAMTMVAVQVMGNDTTIGIAASQGNFELNVFLPVIAYNFITSASLLSEAMTSFEANCVCGIKPNKQKMQANLNQSLMLITSLTPIIGYENGAKVAKKALKENKTLKQACIELNLLTEEQFDQAFHPEQMV